MKMGLGKTAVTLSAINQLIFAYMEVRKVLVIAPLKVAESTWTDELCKWDHLKRLRMSLVLDDMDKRIKALRTPAHIYVINRENVAWLVNHYMSAWPFDMVVVDELPSFKNPASQRFKALRMIRPKVKRLVGLTGTPIPNGLPDLWAQMYLIDMGERLGKTITYYRTTYLYPAKVKNNVVYKYGITKENADVIFNKIKDVCISMKAEDYLQMPPKQEITRSVKLSKEVMQMYEKFEDTEVLNLIKEGHGYISAANKGALGNKLLQFANGAIYTNLEKPGQPRTFAVLHDEKLDALAEVLEAANGENMLVFYTYRHDRDRILERFGGKVYEDKRDLEAWNRGEIPLLLAHPASVAYGLNLQAGGRTVVWYGVPYSWDYYDQGNSRLWRQGQEEAVIILRLVCADTMDINTVEAIERKSKGETDLMDAVDARIERVKTKYGLS